MNTGESPANQVFEHSYSEVDTKTPPAHQIEEAAIKPGNKSMRKLNRFAKYGSRAFESGRYFVNTLSETFKNIGVALSGSLLLLPVVIIARGLSVIWSDIFLVLRDLSMAVFRGLFDGLRRAISPIHSLFTYYNKQILLPLLKQVKEDDATAMIAFITLLIIIIGTSASFWMIF